MQQLLMMRSKKIDTKKMFFKDVSLRKRSRVLQSYFKIKNFRLLTYMSFLKSFSIRLLKFIKTVKNLRFSQPNVHC